MNRDGMNKKRVVVYRRNPRRSILEPSKFLSNQPESGCRGLNDKDGAVGEHYRVVRTLSTAESG